MASKAKAAFEDAKKYVDPKKDAAMLSMLTGLSLLAEQAEELEKKIRKLQSAVNGLPR